ncbi:hypothetical protein NQ315_015917 [Exocentrus adspersus]|uniref:DDE Tnp4 domain-containing protein n=1 Tax=Exocentrus adspersus TaxID=1586481 RepID=A0AAV8V7N5_9CUCU|nr:hypothetical protein NQ315_015917 [Exocentrus adspersus]
MSKASFIRGSSERCLFETRGLGAIVPSTVEEWTEISKNFEEYWNLPHCLGALDGKHNLLQAPIQSGSTYYNYKSTFSIALMALVDVDYNFLYVNIGCHWGVSDGGVFKNCQLYKDLERKKINIPAPRSHSSRNIYAPDGTFDKEINGHVVPGSWRNDGNSTSFTSLRNIPRKSSLNVNNIRAEFATYFSSNGSGVRQNEYA